MLVLFGTSACHLCEEAEAMLVELGAQFAVEDIAESDALFERYGLTIPVVRRDDGGELGWPFSSAELLGFISGN